MLLTGIAILVESFGFSSGVIGYIRRGLIDTKTAFTFALVSMPAALLASKYLSLPEISLKGLYSLLMIGLSAYLLQQSFIASSEEDENILPSTSSFSSSNDESLLTSSTGTILFQIHDVVLLSLIGILLILLNCCLLELF